MNNSKCMLPNRFAISMLTLAFTGLLLMAGCGNDGNPNSTYNKRGDNSCAITPALKKVVKKYKDVFQISNGLIVVGSDTPMTDETGRSFYPQGCIDVDGNVIVPIKYNSINIGEKAVRVSCFTSQGVRYGLFDYQGNTILPIEYEEVFWPDVASSGFARIKKNGLNGVVDMTGKIVIPIQYEILDRFYVEAAYRCYTREQLPEVFIAYRNKNGKPEVFNLSPEKMSAKPSSSFDVTLIGNYGSQSFMDYEGRIIAGPYQNVRMPGNAEKPLFYEGLAAVVKNNKVGFIDYKGEVKIPFQFEYSELYFNISSLAAYMFSEDLCSIMKNKKWGYIDKQGDVKIPYEYDCAYCFHQGSAVVGKLIDDKTWHGLIDKNGAVLLPFEFESATYTGNVLTMCQNGKWGVYSPQGLCLVSCQYEQQIVFYKGYATVMLNGKKGLIDEQGQLLIPCEYESVLYDERANLVYVKQNGKVGYVDLSNKEVVPIVFDWVDACLGFNGNLFYVSKDGRRGLYDRCGNCTLD